MSRTERRKGAEGELEVAKLARARGFDCDRTPNSGGLRFRGDLYGDVPAHLEVKRQETARPWLWFEQASSEAAEGELAVVAMRRNRSPWLALLELEALLDLLNDVRILRRRVAEFEDRV